MCSFTLRTFLFSCSLLLPLFAKADGNKEQALRLGDAAYSHKAYDSAVSYYEQAAAGKAPDAVALYKLGNAHFRLKHIGEAMLAYERALLRKPGFALAAKNARIVQASVRLGGNKEIFFLRWWRGFTAPELSNVWAVLAILTFTALLGILGWSFFQKSRMVWLRPQVIGGALALTALFIVFSVAGVWRDAPSGAAVVMRPDAKFSSIGGGNGGLALPEGLLLRVLHRQGGQITVALPDGQEGFVQLSDIAVVE